MKGTWTLHHNTGEMRNPQLFRDFYAAPDVDSAFLLHDNKEWIDYALDNCETVIVRPYNPFKDNHKYPDETWFMRHDPEAPLRYLNANHARYRGIQRLRWEFTNEPEHSATWPITRQISHIAEAARKMAGAGYGSSMGGWAAAKTVRIENNQFIQPEDWRPALEVVRDFPDIVNLSFHEYITAKFQWPYLKQHELPFPDIFLDWPALTNTDNWSRIPVTGQKVLSNYYVGRRHLVREYGRSIGIGEYMEALTESPWDSMWEDHWKNFIDLKFEPLFGKPKGIRTLRRYFAWLRFMKEHPNHTPAISKATVDLAFAWYTTTMFNEDLISDLRYWKQENADFNLMNVFFAASTNVEWVDCCDITHPDFWATIAWMMDGQSEDTMPEQPVPDLPLEQEFMRSTGAFTYIRTAPDGDIIGKIPNSGAYAIVLTEPQGEHQWRLIEIPNGVKGWVAFKYITRERPPVYEIKLTLTSAQVAALRDQLKNPP